MPICSVFSSFKRSIVHASTFSENSLSMRAGLATLDVLESANLGGQAAQIGGELQQQLTGALSGYEMVKEVRGKGLLLGIEFAGPAAPYVTGAVRGVWQDTSCDVRTDSGHAAVPR